MLKSFRLLAALVLVLLASAPRLFAQVELEPNDTKATANLILLPPVTFPGVITGNSTSAAGTGFDYFRVRTATQATPGFYRHRLIITSAIAGHTGTLRGLTQAAGVITAGSDSTIQFTITTSTPPRFNEFYTSEASADVFYRVTGTAATTANYSIDYNVQLVTPIAGPLGLPPGATTMTTVGQTAADTDIWLYDSNRTAIAGAGNDDEPAPGATVQSLLTQTLAASQFTLAIGNFNTANSLASPATDSFRNGNVMDFPGVIANSSATVGSILNSVIGGTAVPATKPNEYGIVFVRFTTPVELMGFSVD